MKTLQDILAEFEKVLKEFEKNCALTDIHVLNVLTARDKTVIASLAQDAFQPFIQQAIKEAFEAVKIDYALDNGKNNADKIQGWNDALMEQEDRMCAFLGEK